MASSAAIPASFPEHLRRFFANLTEVRRLIKIHTHLTGAKPGRRRDVDILNKSGIVLAVACWEAYVEDLASQAYGAMIAAATSPDAFPTRVLALAGKELRDAADERRIWELAGDGWKQTLARHKDQVLAAYLNGFHTPRPGNVDRLFDNLIGLKAMSATWKWRKNPNGHVLSRLETLVDLRGAIAHKVSVDRYVHKSEVIGALDLVQCLAAVSSNRTRDHVRARVAADPWGRVSYGSAA